MCRNCDIDGMCQRQCSSVIESRLQLTFVGESDVFVTPPNPIKLDYQVAQKVSGLSADELDSLTNNDFNGIFWFIAENEILPLIRAQLLKLKAITQHASIGFTDAYEYAAALCIEEPSKTPQFIQINCELTC
ncbi:hypothetical protein F7Q91_02775 [Vibrio chagasii]|uniref:Uncharacterized protein n=1 Tax=Vibrio chagasii TaxID=170679 RepID=A0A7V7NWZ1_9VIBR|nr:hypothetical protein [Vibrio chagasii]KAB0482344.1 hypothetical protein F7Q91_02775 [Vibrio chagasii]